MPFSRDTLQVTLPCIYSWAKCISGKRHRTLPEAGCQRSHVSFGKHRDFLSTLLLPSGTFPLRSLLASGSRTHPLVCPLSSEGAVLDASSNLCSVSYLARFDTSPSPRPRPPGAGTTGPIPRKRFSVSASPEEGFRRIGAIGPGPVPAFPLRTDSPDCEVLMRDRSGPWRTHPAVCQPLFGELSPRTSTSQNGEAGYLPPNPSRILLHFLHRRYGPYLPLSTSKLSPDNSCPRLQCVFAALTATGPVPRWVFTRCVTASK